MKLTWVATSLLSLAAAWQTLYHYQQGKIYLQLNNDEVVVLDFDIAGKFGENTTYKTGQSITAIASPPKSASLFLLDTLHALYGDDAGNMAVSKFNGEEWENIDGWDFSGINDKRYYTDSAVLASPEDNSTVYVYGGQSPSFSSRMVSLDFNSHKFNNISTATKPQPFAGSAVMLGPSPQSNIVVGGQTSNGWLNMFQIATWDFSSGWSFKPVQKTIDIESRRGALVLPVFNSVSGDLMQNLAVNSAVLLGGQLMGKAASPLAAQLKMEDNVWQWQNYSDIPDFEFVGAATVFNTLITLNSTSKREDSYTLQLYDVDTFKSIDSVSSNYKNESHKTDITTKAVVGTVVPVAALAIMGLVGVAIWRHKRKQHENGHEELEDYNFDYFEKPDNPFVLKKHMTNETATTNDDASFHSWMKKRKQYELLTSDSSPNRPRHSFLASNDTLDAAGDVESITKPVAAKVHQPPQLHKQFSFTQGSETINHKKMPDNKSRDSLTDDNVDVQVLVSSKRRSVLRVVNPDSASDYSKLSKVSEDDDSAQSLLMSVIDDGADISDMKSAKSIRQRIPSGRPDLD